MVTVRFIGRPLRRPSVAQDAAGQRDPARDLRWSRAAVSG